MAAGEIYSAARLVDGVLVLGCADPTPPGECCLYPWPDPEGNEGGPYYPASDLPATIVILGIILTHVSGEYLFLSEDELTNVFAGGEEWIASGAFPLQGNACLVGSDPGLFPTPIIDQFSESYTVTISYDGNNYPVTLTRQTELDLCTWAGNSDGLEISVDVYYNSSAFKWVMNVTIVIGESPPAPITGLQKAGPQSSPVGTYGGIYTVS